ncbi:MAG: hypothetical protein KAT70_01295, partial [Thermoplasmata archaeon]|nr:hypothetical protein [Thermoplasmata archaeon]
GHSRKSLKPPRPNMPGMIDPGLCVMCKGGRKLCGLDHCPLLRSVEEKLPRIVHGDRELFGTSPPAVFVGRYGYPKVAAGPMLPSVEMDNAQELVDTKRWTTMDMASVVALRSGLFRPSTTVDVYRSPVSNRVTEAAVELSLSSRSLDTEVLLSKPPRSSRTSFDMFHAPMGPRAVALKARVVDNPSVPRRVDAVVGDTDLGATGGVADLYKNRISEDHIQRLFSMGQLGIGRRRRMVPTRWSITAVQDIAGKEIIERVKTYTTVDKPTHHHALLLGNRFHVLLLPRIWSFEMAETWLKGAFWGSLPHPFSDHEMHWGRKTYASKVTGAYYAARLSVLDHLERLRRQATAIVYREITNEYWAPLGVWVIREGVNKALEAKGKVYESIKEAVEATKPGVDIGDWDRSSVLLREVGVQRTLRDF